jgi:acyl-CoA synthetase (AMP-forming)/AMP-acid ligase II
MTPSISSLIELLEMHAGRRPNELAFLFLSDSGAVKERLTFANLALRALTVSETLAGHDAKQGDRAILLFSPGLDFIVAFFGCLIAGVVAVPVATPRRNAQRDSTAGIVADCSPRYVLTEPRFGISERDDLSARFAEAPLTWIVLGGMERTTHRSFEGRRHIRHGLAFLQYTSGSTSQPKGVMVSHDNLLENLEMIRLALGNTSASTHVTWTPLHHDMGLILNALQAWYVGAACVLIAPVSFLQRPLSWLKAIHDYRAEVAGCPNFGFDLCVSKFRPAALEGIDLSNWRVAFNAAEPVRADTLRTFAKVFSPYGFDASAFYPLYGMAEATLLVSGGRRGEGASIATVSRSELQASRVASPLDPSDAVQIVGCGRALEKEKIAIVDPNTRRRCADSEIGEIWVHGANVAQGYWQNEAASGDTFGAMIIDEQHSARWLRTGDLGCVDARGELFVTGRIKDLIIVRGINYYPQDIELAAERAHPCLRPGFGAAFPVLDRYDQEQVVIVQEVERTERHRIDFDEVVADIREAIAEEHQLSLYAVMLVQPGTIPKTTSGKIQRQLIRRLWQEGRLKPIGGSFLDEAP